MNSSVCDSTGVPLTLLGFEIACFSISLRSLLLFPAVSRLPLPPICLSRRRMNLEPISSAVTFVRISGEKVRLQHKRRGVVYAEGIVSCSELSEDRRSSWGLAAS